jgi:hypothetical protein
MLRVLIKHFQRYWAIFTIRATSAETAKDSFARIGKIGGLEDTESAGKYWLSQLEEPWLLIIDNADNPDLELTGFFPEGDRGHILITTTVETPIFGVMELLETSNSKDSRNKKPYIFSWGGLMCAGRGMRQQKLRETR